MAMEERSLINPKMKIITIEKYKAYYRNTVKITQNTVVEKG